MAIFTCQTIVNFISPTLNRRLTSLSEIFESTIRILHELEFSHMIIWIHRYIRSQHYQLTLTSLCAYKMHPKNYLQYKSTIWQPTMFNSWAGNLNSVRNLLLQRVIKTHNAYNVPLDQTIIYECTLLSLTLIKLTKVLTYTMVG